MATLAVLGGHSFDLLFLCATTGRGAVRLTLNFYTHTYRIHVTTLCSPPCIHQHTLIYPVSLPHNLAPRLPPIPTVCQTAGWDSSHLQCVIASSPPLLEARNSADSALSVVAFFIIRRTTQLSCQNRQLNVWQLQGVQGKDNVHGRKDDICPSLSSPLAHQRLFIPVTCYTWLIFPPGRCCTLCICESTFLYKYSATCKYAALK